MADSKTAKAKRNKIKDSIPKDVVAIALVLILIVGYIGYELYTATHVEVETITAITSTVYDTIDTQALVIRDEHLIDSDKDAVTVACVGDGEKVGVGGNIAMVFSSQENAQKYSKILQLQEKLDYYIDLESKSAGTATDVKSIDKDIISDVNSYIRQAGVNNISSAQSSALDLNDKLTRRQMIIGQTIDFSKVKGELQKQLSELNSASCEPTGFVTTDESGIFSSYTDGCETMFDYDNIKDIDVKTFDSYMDKVSSAKETGSFGKLIGDYEWYFCCKVDAEQIKNINDGDKLNVALKDSNEVIQCEVLCGATVDLGTQESVMVLKSSMMNGQITSMRVENIEIRYKEYTGFKVPSKAIHVNEKGEKIVYALIANQVAARKSEIIYSTKDYSIFSYNPEDKNGIRLYDQIITQGKDLHDGKVYT